MKDKTKKGLIIAGLAAVCVIAVFGISRVLYKEPPVLAEDADVTKPDTKPAYEEEPEKKPENPTPPVDDTPKTGDTKDGMVYVEGFGWLPDEGAGSGTAADDMYENGNKVGIMD